MHVSLHETRGRTVGAAVVVFCVLITLLIGAGMTPVYGQQGTRVALVLATGGLGDQSFNDSAYSGVEAAAAEFGIEYEYVEPMAIAEYETFLTRFAQRRNYDLIISIGFDQADAVSAVSARFPEQKFAIVDAIAEGDQVASYVYKEAERGFLVGAIAGLMTMETDDPKIQPGNTVGVIGGMDIPLINANIAAYSAGARYVNPAADVRHSYVGDWFDPARGKELALAQFDQGVDIIWGAAGRSGLGVIIAAVEAERYVIGADDDQSHEAPDNVLTNGMKYVNNTVFAAIESVVNGEFAPGVNTLGVAEDMLGYSPGLIPAHIRAEVDALAARIVAGDIVPPETIDAVDAWLEQNR